MRQAKLDAKRKRPKKNPLGMYLLDISQVVDDEPSVSWVKPRAGVQPDGPEETLLYTLVQGKGELIMFGGVRKGEKEFDTFIYNHILMTGTTKIPNYLHFISAPRDVV